MKGKYTPVIVFVLAGLAVLLVPLPPVVKGLLYKTYNLVLFCYIIYRAAAPAVKTKPFFIFNCIIRPQFISNFGLTR